MNNDTLAKMTRRYRMKREAGVALLLSVVVLGAFYFLPSNTPAEAAPAAVTAAAHTVGISIHTPTPDAFANVSVHAKAAIVYDLATHKMLWGKNPNAQLPLASVTKLLTTYTAVKALGLNAPITITLGDVETEGDSGLLPGEVFTLQKLARITLTASLNDGAHAIARTVAQHEHTTVSKALAVTTKALGLTQTYALDGSGLDSSNTVSGGYGSPHDIAILAGALVKAAPSIVEATTHLTATAVSEQGISLTHNNTNHEVNTIPGILLSKTGYTDLAGGNLVVVFDIGINHPIAVVALGSTEKDRFSDVDALIAATRAHFAHINTL